MAERKFEIVGKTQVKCNCPCGEKGFPLGRWSVQSKALGVEVDGGESAIVVWCNAPGVPKQADGETPRLCFNANEELTIIEL